MASTAGGFARGKIVLVTGATDGIGKETAAMLAADGSRVIVHGRNARKVEAARKELSERTGAEIEAAVADFSSLEEVARLAEDVEKRFPDLQVLINNAGVITRERRLTRDGFEETFQVNYLAPFLLTQLLRERLEANEPARIIHVTSMLHRGASLDFGNLNGERGFSGYEAYGTSKLALAMYSAELADRIEGSGVTSNCVHPGGVDTKLLRSSYGAGGIPVPEGAKPVVRLASDPALEDVSGRYFNRFTEADPDPRVLDVPLRERLWEETERLLQSRREKRTARPA